MDVLTILLIVVAVSILPALLFFGLLGLALFVWSWRRIGPYFVDFGRWIGNWRNYVPCGCLLFGGIVLLLLVAAILPQQFDIVRIILLVLISVILAVCSMFAGIIWSIRLGRWVWTRFREGFWQYLERLWNAVSQGVSTDGRGRAKRPGKRPRPRPKAGGDEAAAAAGAHGLVARPAARVIPPARRSLLDLSWLWAMVWGKPQKPARGPRPVARGPEQAQPAVVAERTAPPRVAGRPKVGLRPLMWRLGLLGKPRQPGGKPKPAALNEMAKTPAQPVATPIRTAAQPPSEAGVPAGKPVEGKAKPTMVVGPKPRRGTLKGIGGVGRSVADAAEAARKGFWAGAFWVGRKARRGVDSILRLLHVGGKRR